MKRGYSEGALANAVGDYLRGEIHKGRNVIKVGVPFPGMTFTCVANERTSEAEGAKFKRRGARAGVTDYLFWWDGKGHGCIEIKDESGSLSPTQKDFKSRIEHHGFPWALCRTVAGVRDTLISWGLECKNMNAIEPAASFETRSILIADLYKPL